MRTGKECIDYLNSTVWATLRPSPIQGIGVFAIRNIPKGTEITDHMIYGEEHMHNQLTPEEMDALIPAIRKLILDRTYFKESSEVLEFYSPNLTASLQSWMNHSYTPNTTGTHALRDIAEGEELTEDYRTLIPGHPHPISKKHMKFLMKGGTRRRRRKS